MKLETDVKGINNSLYRISKLRLKYVVTFPKSGIKLIENLTLDLRCLVS